MGKSPLPPIRESAQVHPYAPESSANGMPEDVEDADSISAPCWKPPRVLMFFVVVLLFMPGVVILLSFFFGGLLAAAEQWPLMDGVPYSLHSSFSRCDVPFVGFYLVISTICGLPDPLTEAAPE